MGLRQGDPLSPYLFILGSELLLRKLKLAREIGQITGFKVGENGEGIGSQMYADDSIVIARACRKEASMVATIIREYCGISGQSVNFHKSSIFFSDKVERRVRKTCCRSLGIQEGRGPFKYLGVMIGSKRLPASTFDPLIDRIRNKVSSWKSNSLSFAAKVTLIKSVLSSMPIYLLSATWVPKRVIAKLEVLFRKFLWGRDVDHRGLPLVAWDVICRPKSEGGLGVRELGSTRDALLGKQLARVVGGASSPAAKLLRWKYEAADVWNVSWRRGASASWRALSSASEVVKQGLRWNIGDGRHINVWKDTWLFDNPIAKLVTMTNAEIDLSLLNVSDLWQGREWDVSVLQNLFGEDLVNKVLQVAIPVTTMEDQLLWRGRPLLEFNTKVAYEMIHAIPPIRSGLGVEWSWIWKLGVPEKIKMFIWKMGHLSIPTKDFLHLRKLVNDLRCPRCVDYAEDLFHLVVDCNLSKEIWNGIKTSFGLDPMPGDIWSWWSWFMKGGKDAALGLERTKCRSIIAYTVWELWRQRNMACFDKQLMLPKVVVDMAMNQWREWWSYLEVNPREKEDYLRKCMGIEVRWLTPTEGWLKVNFDGSLDGSGEAGAAYVIRNHEGRMLAAGGSYLSGCYDINEAELRGAWDGIVQATIRQLQASRLWVEGDNKFVIGLISGIHRRCFNLSHDVRSMLSGLQEVKVSHIFREGNSPANWVANYCRTVGRNFCWTENFPQELIRLVEADASGVVFVRE